MGALTDVDVAAVQEVWDTMQAANMAMDWTTFAAHMTDDHITLDPRIGGPLKGLSAWRSWVDAMDVSDPDGSFTVEQVAGDGDLACVVWTFGARWMENGVQMDAEGKGMSLFRRESDGAWRMSHNAWNMNP